MGGIRLGNDSHVFQSQRHELNSFRDDRMEIVVVNHSLTFTRTNTLTHTHTHTHSDVDECAKNNGGCDSERKCTNTAGSSKCEDCPAGYVNDGPKGCKG